MWNWFSRKPRAGGAPAPRRARLAVEQLEQRDCPAAPSLSISVVYGPQATIVLVGQVLDEDPASAVVNFVGPIAGSVTPNADGWFSYMAEAGFTGTIVAQALDNEGLQSNVATAIVTSAAPRIVNFHAADTGGGMWVFTGQVIDEHASGLMVRLTGLPSFGPNGLLVECDTEGKFFIGLILRQEDFFREATATVTDWFGQNSTPVHYFINPA